MAELHKLHTPTYPCMHVTLRHMSRSRKQQHGEDKLQGMMTLQTHVSYCELIVLVSN